jgi:hypothetical protein
MNSGRTYPAQVKACLRADMVYNQNGTAGSQMVKMGDLPSGTFVEQA